jgi:hypothetical protein
MVPVNLWRDGDMTDAVFGEAVLQGLLCLLPFSQRGIRRDANMK